MGNLARLVGIVACAFGATALFGCSGTPEQIDATGTSGDALTGNSPVNHATPGPFDILSFGIDDGTPFIRVRGKAGSLTPPANGDIGYAYVFVTDKGIFADASHPWDDSGQVSNDLEWHSHIVTLDSNNCVTSIADAGEACMRGPFARIRETGATTISAAMTVSLLNSGGKVCVNAVFDSASK